MSSVSVSSASHLAQNLGRCPPHHTVLLCLNSTHVVDHLDRVTTLRRNQLLVEKSDGSGIHIVLMVQCHNFCRASQSTLTTFQTVWIEIAYFLSAAVVGCELHRADAGTALTLHLTGTRYVDVPKGFG